MRMSQKSVAWLELSRSKRFENTILKFFSESNLISLQLRKAIEDVNSGNLVQKSQTVPDTPVTPITPVCEPLLMKMDKEVNNSNNTMTSFDSLQSNSENNSTDIELDNIRNNMKLQ